MLEQGLLSTTLRICYVLFCFVFFVSSLEEWCVAASMGSLEIPQQESWLLAQKGAATDPESVQERCAVKHVPGALWD